MALTRLTEELDNISRLADEPGEGDGLTASGLKAHFDAAGLSIKDYINNVLLPELETAGGDSLGMSPVPGLEGNTVRELILSLKDKIKNSGGGFGGGLMLCLEWENSSSGSAFPAQTVGIDGGSPFYLIKWAAGTDDDSLGFSFMPVSGRCRFMTPVLSGGENPAPEWRYREAEMSPGAIRFSSGMRLDTSGAAEDDSCALPLAVCSIKAAIM